MRRCDCEGEPLTILTTRGQNREPGRRACTVHRGVHNNNTEVSSRYRSPPRTSPRHCLRHPRAGCITVRLEPLENRNSPRIPTKACPASHRCSLLGSGVIRGLKPPRPCIFPHVDFISCAWTALLGNQSITVRTVGVRGGVEQLQRSCTTSPKLPYHALE